MARHPSLRTVFFETEEGEPRQRVLQSWRPETWLIDATGFTEAEITDAVTREFHRAFDVRESVLRIPVFRQDDNDIILFVYHHLAVDGFSLPVCFEELRELYAAELEGRAPRLTPVQSAYREFVEWEAQLVGGPSCERLWKYWKRELAGDLPVLSLPSSRPRPAVYLPRGEQMPMSIDRDFSSAIHEAARQSKTTTFSFLLAAFEALLCLYSGQDDVIVGTSSSLRTDPKWANTVGYIVNLLPVRCKLSGDTAFSEHLARTRDTVLSALDHQSLPFPLLLERLRIRRDMGQSPVFQAFFNYLTDRSTGVGPFLLGLEDCAVQFGGSVLRPWINLTHHEVQADIMLYLADFGERIWGYVNYNADVVDQAVAQAMAVDYLNMLRSIVLDPQIRIGDLPVTPLVQKAEAGFEELLL